MDVNLNKVDEIIRKYGRDPGGLIPVLLKIEEEFGYLPENALSEISSKLSVSSLRMKKVISFYDQFAVSPKGKNVIKVCQGLNCSSNGGKLLIGKISGYLGIKPGETTGDGLYTLETIPCQGMCNVGPVMIINNNIYSHMTSEKIDQIFLRQNGDED
ncbi:MAG: NAD(P)H-dependent oxidoreductase subunit E [Bacillota bacterium]